MRMFGKVVAVGFVLLPITAHAQSAASAATNWSVDFGLRGTSLSGDGARYERYRDLGDGLFVEAVRVNRETKGWIVDFSADHVGRRDQRFSGGFVKPGKLKGWAMWDQIPMLMSRTTRTLFVDDIKEAPAVLTISDAIQAQVQATPSSLAAIFASSAVAFDTRSRRHLAQAGFEYLATPALTVRTKVQYTDRQGTLPYGGSFGHGSLVEIPAPIQHRLTDFDANAEFSRNPLLLRVGYGGSLFHNDATTVTFDNPFRATDIASASSRGRLSLAPTNSFYSVNGLVSVKLPRRSRATAYVSVGSLKDAGDPIMPQTVNTANVTAPLGRSHVDGEARTTSVNLSFVSRPTPYTDVNIRYRSYDYDNRTPEFAMRQRVSYDNAPANLADPVHTEPFSVLRHTFDADFTVTPMTRATAGVGFSRTGEDRTHRIFHATTDNILRLVFDSVGNPWFSLRTKYEHAQRRGEGIEEGERELAAIGEQPGIRHFDIAPRDRDRVTILGSITPTGVLSLNASVAAGTDDYRLELPQTSTRPESLFGLRDNTHRVYSVGIDAVPTELVTVGGSYSYERYNALSRSRQASPGVQFTDVSRNWSAEGTDRIHSVILTAGISKIADKVDLHLSYEANRARALYQYIAGAVPNRTLPEETTVDTTLPAPTALPLMTSELQRGTADLVYALTSRIGIGVSYWHERYRVTDFTLDVDANPDLVRGQALLIGYLYRPYTANTVWGRLIYRW
jgi:MtrB/PioB family decaheme-associated outer membrane protein